MGEQRIIKIICKHCGNGESIIKQLESLEFGECTECHKMTYSKQFSANTNNKIVRCPYCNHWDTKKISKASKVGSVALWGVYGLAKASKEWHCNNCGSDF